MDKFRIVIDVEFYRSPSDMKRHLIENFSRALEETSLLGDESLVYVKDFQLHVKEIECE